MHGFPSAKFSMLVILEEGEDQNWPYDQYDEYDDWSDSVVFRWEREDEERREDEAAKEELEVRLLFPVRLAEQFLDWDHVDRIARGILS